jgi:hypothetical protein
MGLALVGRTSRSAADLLVSLLGIGGAVAAQAAGAPFFDDQDYSRNKTYHQGMHAGKSDRAHNEDHSKKRHFKKDEDQKAYEAGYQKAHGN